MSCKRLKPVDTKFTIEILYTDLFLDASKDVSDDMLILLRQLRINNQGEDFFICSDNVRLKHLSVDLTSDTVSRYGTVLFVDVDPFSKSVSDGTIDFRNAFRKLIKSPEKRCVLIFTVFTIDESKFDNFVAMNDVELNIRMNVLNVSSVDLISCACNNYSEDCESTCFIGSSNNILSAAIPAESCGTCIVLIIGESNMGTSTMCNPAEYSRFKRFCYTYIFGKNIKWNIKTENHVSVCQSLNNCILSELNNLYRFMRLDSEIDRGASQGFQLMLEECPIFNTCLLPSVSSVSNYHFAGNQVKRIINTHGPIDDSKTLNYIEALKAIYDLITLPAGCDQLLLTLSNNDVCNIDLKCPMELHVTTDNQYAVKYNVYASNTFFKK